MTSKGSNQSFPARLLYSLKQRAGELKTETYAIYLASRHPLVPWYAKAFLGLVIGYMLYPVGVAGLEAVQTAVGASKWPDAVEVRVLDVGQGSAVLVRTPERHALLFDGGPRDCDLAGQLRSLGVQKLDVVVISHPHADHFAGLLQSLDAIEIATLVDHVQVTAASSLTASSGPGLPLSVVWDRSWMQER